jgi:catechol 2,3-dioxygenase-like lactoylglutathione lyase family enzyme
MGFDHISLIVDDVEKSTQFYIRFFEGKQLSVTALPGEGVRLAYVDCGGQVLELRERTDTSPRSTGDSAARPDDGTSGGIGHMAIRVRNVEETAERLSKRGLARDSNIVPAPVGKGNLFTIHDPEGNRIQLLDRGDLRKSY